MPPILQVVGLLDPSLSDPNPRPKQKERKIRAQSHRGRVETGKWTAKGKENKSPEPKRKG